MLTGTTVLFGSAQEEGVAHYAIVLLVFLPVAQLVASILTLFCIVAWSEAFPDQKTSLRRLGRITFFSLLGFIPLLIFMLFGFRIFY